MKLIPKVKIWLSTESSEGVFGGGKCRLLKAIHEHGSLSAAAEQLNISYRKAWGDLKKAESCLGIKLVSKTRGGVGGGKTSLTDEGIALTEAYTKFSTEIKNHIDETYEKNLKGILNETH